MAQEQAARPDDAAPDPRDGDTEESQVRWRKKESSMADDPYAAEAEGDAPPAAGVPEAASTAEWQALYAAEQARAEEYLGKWQRAAADYANMRRRHESERQETVKQGNASLLKGILPVLDSFDRALETMPAELRDVPWVGGVMQIARQLHGVLEREGLSRIEALGKPFDPNLHEALVQEESEQPADTVTGELQGGYRLHDRVLRPSMVKVAK